MVVVCWRGVHSPFGRVLRCIKQNEQRARFLGYRVWIYKWLVFVFSAAIAALSGALFAMAQQSAYPNVMSLQQSGFVVMMVLIGGGLVSFWGPVLGAAFFLLARDLLGAYTETWLLWYGLLFKVQVVGAVDHDRDGGQRGGVRGQLGVGGAVGRGVGHDDVVEALPCQPQRLRQREAQDALVARQAQHFLQQSPAAHRLAGHADRLARGAPGQILGVGVERVEVDGGERRLEGGGRGVEAAAVRCGSGRGGGHEISVAHASGGAVGGGGGLVPVSRKSSGYAGGGPAASVLGFEIEKGCGVDAERHA